MNNLQLRHFKYTIARRANRYSHVSVHFFKTHWLVITACKAITNPEHRTIVSFVAIGLFMLLYGILSSGVGFIILGILMLMASLMQ